MADDLASRISDASVAALELVPGEQRFADLSNHVLRGGASRFAPVVLDDEHLRYVLPVGIPGASLVYGTLLIQKSRFALVWRQDPSRPYHAQTMELGPETVITQSPVTLRGEVWGRFDLRRPGSADVTFLVPPVASPALPRMLHRVLIEEPHSQLGRTVGAPLPVSLTEPSPAPEGSIVADAPVEASSDPGEPTELLAAADKPVAPPTWTPRRPEEDGPHLADEALYRPTVRVSPLTSADDAPPEPPTRAVVHAEQSAPPPEIAAPAGFGDLAKGFVTGLVATLIVGGLYVVARLAGWL